MMLIKTSRLQVQYEKKYLVAIFYILAQWQPLQERLRSVSPVVAGC